MSSTRPAASPAPLGDRSTSTRAPSTSFAPGGASASTKIRTSIATTPKATFFSRPDGKPTHPQLLSDVFQKLVRRSGLPRLRFHDLRHTHATLLLKAGVPIKVVSARLGHSTPGFTMATYQHVIPGMQREAAQVFASILEGCPKPPGLLPGKSPGRRHRARRDPPRLGGPLAGTSWWRGQDLNLHLRVMSDRVGMRRLPW